MAGAVEQLLALDSSGSGELVVEAGTGIGKTLAYLVPVLQSGQRCIVSTGTKTLQDQLYFRDLPLVAEALGLKIKTALLKGRANYLCLHRMDLAISDGHLPSREAVIELAAVRDWSNKTKDGDLTITPVISDSSGLLPLVTSTPDNCLGADCPRFDECFVARARREAQDADVVVVNHHLLFADMAIKQSGFGEILPGASAFVIDEAHLAPETAARFFSQTLSSRAVEDLCRDFLAECGELTGALGVIKDPLDECRKNAAPGRYCCAMMPFVWACRGWTMRLQVSLQPVPLWKAVHAEWTTTLSVCSKCWLVWTVLILRPVNPKCVGLNVAAVVLF
jgi:ATP-dependent DNA helicase DinG